MKTKVIIKRLGGPQAIARALGITHGAVCQWQTRKIPAERCPELEALAKGLGVPITKEDMRPDVFRRLI